MTDFKHYEFIASSNSLVGGPFKTLAHSLDWVWRVRSTSTTYDKMAAAYASTNFLLENISKTFQKTSR